MALLYKDGADSRVTHDPIVVRKIKIIKQHRSITKAMNRQPSLS